MTIYTLQARENAFLEKATSIHGDRYSYNEMEYKNSSTKIKLACHTHGFFWTTPTNHISRKSGCPACAVAERSAKFSDSFDDFIKKLPAVNISLYTYEEDHYKGNGNKMKIYCRTHEAFFEQTPNNHLQGQHCPRCGLEKRAKTRSLCLREYVARCNAVHNYVYDYSLVDSEKFHAVRKIDIICPGHGVFTQSKSDHLYSKSGCPVCNASKGERLIESFLIEHNIRYTKQKSFSDLWGKTKRAKLRYDFFIDELNLLIEYDGQQHFEDVSVFSEGLSAIQKRDNVKTQYARDNNINLLRIPYYNRDKINEILSSAISVGWDE